MASWWKRCFRFTRVNRSLQGLQGLVHANFNMIKKKLDTLATIKPYILGRGNAKVKIKLAGAAAITALGSYVNISMSMLLGKTAASLRSDECAAEFVGIQMTPTALVFTYISFWVASQVLHRARGVLTDDIVWDSQMALSDGLIQKTGELSFAYRSDPDNHSSTTEQMIERSKWSIFSLVQGGIIGTMPSMFEILGATLAIRKYLGLSYSAALTITAAAYTIYTSKFFAYVDKRHTEVENSFQEVSAQVADSLQNQETADYHGNIAHEREYILSRLVDNKNKILKTTKAYSLVEMGQAFILRIGAGYILFRNVTEVMEGNVTPENFIILHSLLLKMCANIEALGSNLTQVGRAVNELAGAARIFKTQPIVVERPDAYRLSNTIYSIEFKNVTFSYPKSTNKALDNVSFKILQGTKVGFVGETGSGKSTIFKLLMRFYDVDSGEILINGVNIQHYTIDSLRKAIAAVPQETGIFSRSLRENILYGRLDATEAELSEVIAQSQLSSFFAKHSLDEKVGERGVTLSGGEKQRVGIARALLKRSGVYLLDEVTAALDAGTEKEIMENFSKVTRGKMVITIAHRLSTVQDYDVLIVLDSGRIIQQGSHKLLVNQKGGKYRFLWEQQNKKQDTTALSSSDRESAAHSLHKLSLLAKPTTSNRGRRTTDSETASVRQRRSLSL